MKKMFNSLMCFGIHSFRNRYRSTRTILPALAMVIGMGCATTPPPVYYTLTPIHFNNNPSLSGHDPYQDGPSLGIGPVTIPSYLDRSQIITRTEQHMLHLAEHHQWISLPGEQVTGVLRENLSQLLNTSNIQLHPWPRYRIPKFQILLDVVRLDGMPGKMLYMTAWWALIEKGREKEIRLHRFEDRVVIEQEGYAAYAEAHSRLIGRLCGDIAEAVRLETGNPL